MKVLLILCVFFFICTLFLFFILTKELKENKKLNEEVKNKNEHADKTADIITEANKTKADARTGDHSADFNYMADKLHDYANR